MGDQVILRRVLSDFISRPISLTRDYSSSLSGVVHNNVIYYAYITKEGTIDVRHVGSNSYIFRFDRDESHLLYNPILTSMSDRLVLFYCCENSGNKTWDAGYIILSDAMSDRHITVANSDLSDNISSDDMHYNRMLASVSHKTAISVINIDSHILINAYYFNNSFDGNMNQDTGNANRIKSDSRKNNHIFELSPDMSLISYNEINALAEERNHFHMERISELQSNIETLQQAGSNMMNKISSLLQENDALKKECRSLQDENSNTKKALTIRESQIESAKRQYNELMNVAERYRDEAAKWRMKLTSK